VFDILMDVTGIRNHFYFLSESNALHLYSEFRLF